MDGTDSDRDERADSADAEPKRSHRTLLEVAILASAAPDTGAGPDAGRSSIGPDAAVVVVARESDMRVYIRDCLSVLPVRIIEAADLPSAVAAAEGVSPDLLILDISGPDPASSARLAGLLPLSTLALVPCVLIAEDGVDPAPRPDADIAAVVVKPFNSRTLRQEVNRCLGGRPREP